MSMEVRGACLDDWSAIEKLCQTSRRTLPRLWGWEEHFSEDVFVVTEQLGTVVGAFLAWSDESPVAWVRLAVLDEALNASDWLDLVLPPVLDGLRRRRTLELAWMDFQGWAGPLLKDRGFGRLAEVVTLIKFDHALPHVRATKARLRPAGDEDWTAVTAVDRAAFAPHWWYGGSTLRRRIASPSHFMVADVAGEVVGYSEGELRLPGAHLNRIAVHPDHQGHGIGTLLLHDAVRAFWRRGAERVTLNTQTDNRSSRRLYHHLGFELTGDRVAAWSLQLQAGRERPLLTKRRESAQRLLAEAPVIGAPSRLGCRSEDRRGGDHRS
jgi:ribosomal protein S18 acetylase RimI-like enzyme